MRGKITTHKRSYDVNCDYDVSCDYDVNCNQHATSSKLKQSKF